VRVPCGAIFSVAFAVVGHLWNWVSILNIFDYFFA